MEPHNKIINDVAKRILKPEGLFRVGSSRSWIEDNGYLFTIVNFEPSGYTKGSYLNVGIDFMWGNREENNESLAFEVGGRIFVGKGTHYVDYRPRVKNCDELFTQGIEKFAEAALLKVKEYRNYCDLDYAKEMLTKSVKDIPIECQFWDLYRLAMLCFFKGDYIEGKDYFYEYLEQIKNSFYGSIKVIRGDKDTIHTGHIEWREAFYHYCMETIVPMIEDAKTAQQMVFNKINKRRAIFSSKTSYKKMKKEIYYK